jgi:hypothetical protein
MKTSGPASNAIFKPLSVSANSRNNVSGATRVKPFVRVIQPKEENGSVTASSEAMLNLSLVILLISVAVP